MAETPRRLRDVSGSSALSEFRSEDEPVAPTVEDRPPAKGAGPPKGRIASSPPPQTQTRQQKRRVLWAVGAAVTVIAVGLGVFLFRSGFQLRLNGSQPPAVRPGQITLDTVPAGVQVVIGGQVLGITPLTIPLPPGHHEVVLRNGTEERTIPLEMTSGAEIIHRVEFAPAAVSGAKLSVTTEPPGARVAIDGETRGVSPFTIADLSAGRHKISVTGAGGSSERTVITEAGTTTSVVFSSLTPPKAPAGIDAGWLTITAPFEVKVMERDELIGTSASSKLMIPAGSHELDLINPSLGYQNHRKVEIESGKTAVVRVDSRAPLNVNARPWAEVIIDGTPIGVTPIANQILALGNHQVVFRHPQLGERRQDIVITLQGPNRISVDMAK